MFKVKAKRNEITLTRGDSAYMKIKVVQTDIDGKPTGEEYVPGGGDQCVATVRKDDTSEILFQSEIPIDTMVWHILPDDTWGANMDDDYVFDVQLTTEGGDVFTIIKGDFLITSEVTYEY